MINELDCGDIWEIAPHSKPAEIPVARGKTLRCNLWELSIKKALNIWVTRNTEV